MSGDQKVVRVGSRKSQLAIVQSENVIKFLSSKFPSIKFEIDKALSKIGDKSLFTKELEVALLDHRVDFVVHSLKDVPTELAPGLTVAGICQRDDSRDALIVKKGSKATSLSTLPKGSVVGTSSMRRTAQLRRLHPHLEVLDVRGNLNTRLTKLDEEGGPYDALVLASAGLARLGWEERITQTLLSDEVMYAVGQGAMCAECRSDDVAIMELLCHVNHPDTILAILAERSFLNRLEGGCSVPVAVVCDITGDQLVLKGGVYSLDGSEALLNSVQVTLEGYTGEVETGKDHLDEIKPITAVTAGGVAWKHQQKAQALGIQLADKLKEAGAKGVLAQARLIAAEEMAVNEALKQQPK